MRGFFLYSRAAAAGRQPGPPLRRPGYRPLPLAPAPGRPRPSHPPQAQAQAPPRRATSAGPASATAAQPASAMASASSRTSMASTAATPPSPRNARPHSTGRPTCRTTPRGRRGGWEAGASATGGPGRRPVAPGRAAAVWPATGARPGRRRLPYSRLARPAHAGVQCAHAWPGAGPAAAMAKMKTRLRPSGCKDTPPRWPNLRNCEML